MTVRNWRRAQSSLEYLASYGWAVLAVLAISVVIWQSGSLGIGKNTLPGNSGFSQIRPIGWTAEPSGSTANVDLTVINDADTELLLTGATSTACTGTSSLDANIPPGQTAAVSLTGCGLSGNAGDYFRMNVALTYFNPSSGISHSSVGNIWGALGYSTYMLATTSLDILAGLPSMTTIPSPTTTVSSAITTTISVTTTATTTLPLTTPAYGASCAESVYSECGGSCPIKEGTTEEAECDADPFLGVCYCIIGCGDTPVGECGQGICTNAAERCTENEDSTDCVCETKCESSRESGCDGVCPDGKSCMTDLDGPTCSCKPPCADTFPDCSGTCEDENKLCALNAAKTGCECTVKCENSPTPACNGACPGGDPCYYEDLFDYKCRCTKTCANTFPACDGTCPGPGGKCHKNDAGTACICSTNCGSMPEPACGGGYCEDDKECVYSTGLLGLACRCETPCGDKQYPSCLLGKCPYPRHCKQKEGGGGCDCEKECADTFPDCDGACTAGQLCKKNEDETACVCEETACKDMPRNSDCDGSCAGNGICMQDANGYCYCLKSCEECSPPKCDGWCIPPKQCMETITTAYGNTICECIDPNQIA